MLRRDLPAKDALTSSDESPGSLLLDGKLRSLHAVMRGRYSLAIGLALIAAVIGCGVGYLQGRITYKSTVRLRVAPVVPRVLYASEEKGVMPEYERFVETQMDLIKSEPVLTAAAKDKNYIAAGGKNDETGFDNTIDVTRENEIVSIEKIDSTPAAAVAGVQATVDAYHRLYLAEDANTDTRRLEILRQYQQTLTDDLGAKKQALLAVGNKYGSPNINSLYVVKLDEFKRLQGALTDLQITLSLSSGAPAELQPEDLAGVDPTVAGLLQDRGRLQTQLAMLLASGLQNEHPAVKAVQGQIDSIDSRVQSRLAQISGSPDKLAGRVVGGSGRPLLSPSAIHLQLDQLHRAYDQCEADLADLGRASLQVADLNNAIETISKKLDDTNERISQLGVEGGMSGRITTIAEAERPNEPFKDTRRMFAAAGLLGGLTCGFGGVLLPTLLNRKLRSVEEMRLRLTGEQVLGMLPEMNGSDAKSLDQKAVAAHAVHQIRSMLQIRNRQANPTYAITSPASGSGKTSLAMGLAMSYASAGSRTLLIDCDLVAGGLTRRMEPLLRSQIGDILANRGIITAAQLADARTLAQQQGLQLTEALVQMRCISAEALDRELKHYHLRAPGVLRAVDGKHFDDCVLDTEVKRLSFIPRGGVWEQNAASLTPRNVRRLIDLAKERFDVILIDSGPLPASLEAAVVAAEADGAVLIVSRGESHGLVESCLAQLASVQARLAGAVFNRADGPDLRAAASYSNASRSDHPGLPDRRPNATGTTVHDPIARAVASSIGSYDDELDADSLALN